jgi:chromosome partitioning protein
MYKISIINQKGGCGKTTTAVNLASLLVELKKKVLLIDLDPQSHATLSLGVNPEDADYNSYDFLKYVGKEDFSPDQVIRHIEDNFFLVPSHLVLSVFEQAFSGIDDHEYRLKDALKTVEDVYDYVIIDCPPSLSLLTVNALMVSDQVMVPIEPSKFAMQGISRLKDTIKLIEEKTGHELLVRALITLYDRRTKFSEYIAQQVRELFKQNAYETIIHQTVRFKESSYYGKPINKFDRRSSGFNDYLSLAKEVLSLSEKLSQEAFHSALHDLAGQFNSEDKLTSVTVPFLYEKTDARDIKIVGDFNNWTPDDSSRLTKDDKGRWMTTLELKPGRYQYKLVVDGQWHEDENNPSKIECPFGGFNSLLEIGK